MPGGSNRELIMASVDSTGAVMYVVHRDETKAYISTLRVSDASELYSVSFTLDAGATDIAASPVTPSGKIIVAACYYAVGLGVVTFYEINPKTGASARDVSYTLTSDPLDNYAQYFRSMVAVLPDGSFVTSVEDNGVLVGAADWSTVTCYFGTGTQYMVAALGANSTSTNVLGYDGSNSVTVFIDPSDGSVTTTTANGCDCNDLNYPRASVKGYRINETAVGFGNVGSVNESDATPYTAVDATDYYGYEAIEPVAMPTTSKDSCGVVDPFLYYRTKVAGAYS